MNWGRVAGSIAGVSLFGQTALFLADAFDWLDESPEFHETSAGPRAMWRTTSPHTSSTKHAIVCDIIVRDTHRIEPTA